MNRILFAAFAVVVLVFGGFGLFGSSKAAVSPTDLVVGQIYEVADFRTCRLADGSSAYEWHFGGADRSRRNQLTPALDGRGRRILRRTSDIPAGTMRLRRVTERAGDPTLEGFTYGTYRYAWEGIVVELNGRMEPQKVVRPCGPAR